MAYKQVGISLIELLVAIALGSLVLLGLFNVYAAVKTLYREQNIVAVWQENLRLVSNIFLTNISSAGFAGCRKLTELKLINHSPLVFSSVNSIIGFSAAHLPNYLQGIVKPDTDVLQIQKADKNIAFVLAPVVRGSAKIQVNKNPATKFNNWLLLADCMNAELFQAKTFTYNMINSANNFAENYQAKVSTVGRFEEIVFFIGDTGRVDETGRHINALYEIINRGNKRELVPEIDAMHIEYGVTDSSGKKLECYYSTEAIERSGIWQRVISVVVHLEQTKTKYVPPQFTVYIKLQER